MGSTVTWCLVIGEHDYGEHGLWENGYWGARQTARIAQLVRAHDC